MADTFDSIIGKVCVERGWVTRDQLVDCLKQCSSSSPDPAEFESSKSRLTDMLISKGLVTSDQMSALRHEVSRILASDSAYTVVRKGDAALGQLLVAAGTCSKEHLIEALSIQQHAAGKGGDVPRIGEILLQKGYTTFAALEKALETQKEKTLLHCASCRSQYAVVDYNPKKKYLCKKCTGPLLLPHEIPPDIPEEVTNAQRNPKNILGKYVLVKELGRGGMGVVCKAWDTQLKRWVALKVLLGQGGKEELARFRREAQTAAALRHPNIVGIYEVTEIDDKHLIAMEFIDGRSLAGERMPTLKAAEIMAQVAHAVDYAHSKGIIHRDIKPHNIMLDKEGKPFVMDFGLAKSMAAHSQITMAGTVVGTPSYMAPEQASGKVGLVGRQSDVYSLGAVLYEILTGRPPFKGTNPIETLRMVVEEDALLPSQLNSTVLHDLDTIVVKCLEKDREKRYATAKQLAQDLERFSSGGQISARPSAPAARLARKLRKQWAPAAAIGAAVLVLGLIIGIVAFSKPDGKPEARALLQEGDRLSKAGDPRKALAQYEAARAIDPKSVEVLQRLKQAAARIKELEAAEELKKDARAKAQPEIDKGRTKMQRARTAFYQAGADLSRIDPLLLEAVEHFTAALNLAKGDADVYHLRGQAHVLRQNHDAAEKDFTAAIEALKTFSAAYYDRARVYLEYAAEAAGQKKLRDKSAEDEARGWRMKARVDLNTYREQGAQDAEQTETAEALLASSESNYSKVVGLCDRLISRQTSNEEVYKLRADALSNLGHNATVEETKNDFYRQAIQSYTEAIDRKVNYPEAYLERGHIHFHAGNRDAAMKDLDKATAMRLGGSRWYSSRATILHEVGRIDEALADFDRALALKPNDPQILSNLGQVFYQKKDYRRAQEQYDRILAADSKNASALAHRSQARIGLGDLEGASADIAAAARLNPQLRGLGYKEARVSMARKEWRKAEEEFSRHLAAHPEDEPATYQRGIARYNQHKFREAIDDWERCLRLNTRFKEEVEKRLAEARRKLGE